MGGIELSKNLTIEKDIKKLKTENKKLKATLKEIQKQAKRNKK